MNLFPLLSQRMMLILASWISFLMLYLESFIFHSFNLYLFFPMLSSPYSNADIRKVSYSFSLTLIFSSPTWCFALIALISLSVASDFLFNSSIWSFKFPDFLNYTFFYSFYYCFLWFLARVDNPIFSFFFNPYIIFFQSLSFCNFVFLSWCYLLFLLLLYHP